MPNQDIRLSLVEPSINMVALSIPITTDFSQMERIYYHGTRILSNSNDPESISEELPIFYTRGNFLGKRFYAQHQFAILKRK